MVKFLCFFHTRTTRARPKNACWTARRQEPATRTSGKAAGWLRSARPSSAMACRQRLVRTLYSNDPQHRPGFAGRIFGASASGTNLATWRKTSASASAKCCCSRLAAAVRKPWRCSQRPRCEQQKNKWIKPFQKCPQIIQETFGMSFGMLLKLFVGKKRMGKVCSTIEDPTGSIWWTLSSSMEIQVTLATRWNKCPIQQLWPTIELVEPSQLMNPRHQKPHSSSFHLSKSRDVSWRQPQLRTWAATLPFGKSTEVQWDNKTQRKCSWDFAQKTTSIRWSLMTAHWKRWSGLPWRIYLFSQKNRDIVWTSPSSIIIFYRSTQIVSHEEKARQKNWMGFRQLNSPGNLWYLRPNQSPPPSTIAHRSCWFLPSEGFDLESPAQLWHPWKSWRSRQLNSTGGQMSEKWCPWKFPINTTTWKSPNVLEKFTRKSLNIPKIPMKIPMNVLEMFHLFLGTIVDIFRPRSKTPTPLTQGR